MRKKIEILLKQGIMFVGGILITLGAVIFSNLSLDTEILYVTIGIVVFVFLVVGYIIISNYVKFIYKTKQIYKDVIGIEGRIKKDIKRLKKGKRGKYISHSDFMELIKHREKYEKIKDFDIMSKDIDKICEMNRQSMEQFRNSQIDKLF